MTPRLFPAVVFLLLFLCNTAFAQKLTSDVPYVKNGHERHVLDVYTPEGPAKNNLPVMFWIYGGGWQKGDKSDVALKPKVLTERGFVFVATNYRLLPEVTMEELTSDVAKSLGWVHKNISRYGGDPKRIFVGGHSAGAQLAALIRARMADRMGAGREGQAARTWTRSGSRGGSEVHAGVHATAFDREEFSCDDRNLFYGNEVRVPPEGLEPSAL